jgi:hypothetical protein
LRIRAVPAVSRAVAILRLLGKAKEPMGVIANLGSGETYFCRYRHKEISFGYGRLGTGA